MHCYGGRGPAGKRFHRPEDDNLRVGHELFVGELGCFRGRVGLLEGCALRFNVRAQTHSNLRERCHGVATLSRLRPEFRVLAQTLQLVVVLVDRVASVPRHPSPLLAALVGELDAVAELTNQRTHTGHCFSVVDKRMRMEGGGQTSSETMPLDKELISLLREHPEIFSRVLARVLGKDSDDTAHSWNGKFTDYWNDVLVEDMQRVIISKLFEDMARDERVLLDILLFGMVDKRAKAMVAEQMRAIEATIDVVPLLCRALFEYWCDVESFELFLNRVHDFAPAAGAAWEAVLRRNETVRSLVLHLQTERPWLFAAALENNGLDPIATVLCMHHMTEPAKQLSPEAVEKLTPLVLDSVWAMFMKERPRIEAGAPFSFDKAVLACIVRTELAPAPMRKQVFLETFLLFIERVEQSNATLVAVRKELWQRLARIDANLLIEVVVLWRLNIDSNTGVWARYECEEIVYQWFKHVLPPPTGELDLPFELVADASRQFAEHAAEYWGPREQEDIAEWASILRDIEHANTRYLCRFTRVQRWTGVLNSMPPEKVGPTVKTILLESIRRGNDALVRHWIDVLWPAYRQDMANDFEAFAKGIVAQVTRFSVMLKHPAAIVRIQEAVTAFLTRALPNFPPPAGGRWNAYECVSPELQAYLAHGAREETMTRTERARLSYDVMATESLQHLSRPMRFDTLLNLVSLGAQLSDRRPALMHHLYDVVIAEAMKADVMHSQGICTQFFFGVSNYDSTAAVWHFVRSRLFARHVDDRWKTRQFPLFAAYLLRQCGNRALVLAHRFFKTRSNDEIVQAVHMYLNTPSLVAHHEMDVVQWNMVYRCRRFGTHVLALLPREQRWLATRLENLATLDHT